MIVAIAQLDATESLHIVFAVRPDERREARAMSFVRRSLNQSSSTCLIAPRVEVALHAVPSKHQSSDS